MALIIKRISYSTLQKLHCIDDNIERGKHLYTVTILPEASSGCHKNTQIYSGVFISG